MTETAPLHRQHLKPDWQSDAGKCRRCLCRSVIVIVLLILTLFVVALILFFTVFKPKDPETSVTSVSVSGIAPRVSLPAVRVELNLTLDVDVFVHNPNHASFKHGPGKSLLYYREKQVGEVDLEPGRIPSRGSETINCRLTLEIERFASDISQLISDVLAGELAVDVQTRVPGRITFLGIIRRHAVAVSRCHITFGVPDLKIKQQECSQKTKL